MRSYKEHRFRNVSRFAQYAKLPPARARRLAKAIDVLARQAETLIEDLAVYEEPGAAAQMELVLLALREASLEANNTLGALPSAGRPRKTLMDQEAAG